MLPKQGRGPFKKHFTETFSQHVAPDCTDLCEHWVLDTLITLKNCRVANDHDRDQIFGLDCPIPTDYSPIIGKILVGVVLHRPEF